MKLVAAILLGLFLLLQFSLWVGDGSLAEVWRMSQAIKAQGKENAAFKQRNLTLDAEVRDLKHGLEAIEERARSELGMIHKDEIFYQIIEQPLPNSKDTKP